MAINYPVADCIKIVAWKLLEPTISTDEWNFLNNILRLLKKLETGDYGRKTTNFIYNMNKDEKKLSDDEIVALQAIIAERGEKKLCRNIT